MPRRPVTLTEMTPEERANYLAKQPSKVRLEIERLLQENSALRAEILALAASGEALEEASIRWRVRGARCADKEWHALPDHALISFQIGGVHLETFLGNDNLLVTGSKGRVSVSPVAGNVVALAGVIPIKPLAAILKSALRYIGADGQEEQKAELKTQIEHLLRRLLGGDLE